MCVTAKHDNSLLKASHMQAVSCHAGSKYRSADIDAVEECENAFYRAGASGTLSELICNACQTAVLSYNVHQFK